MYKGQKAPPSLTIEVVNSENVPAPDRYLEINFPNPPSKYTVLDGEQLAWHGEDQAVIKHSGSLYIFSVDRVEAAVVNAFLSTFKFLK